MQMITCPTGVSRWFRHAGPLLLALALFGCGGGGASDGTPALAQGTPIPAALQGQWETILTYVPAFYAGPFQETPNGDGSIGIAFYFFPDGRYQHVWNLMQTYFGGNCFRTAHWEEHGTMSGAGPTYTFNPGKATFSQLDTCGQNQYQDSVPMTPASHRLTLDRDNTGWPLLHMGFQNGELVLEKCRRCQ